MQRIALDQDLMHLELNLEKLVDDANGENAIVRCPTRLRTLVFAGLERLPETH